MTTAIHFDLDGTLVIDDGEDDPLIDVVRAHGVEVDEGDVADYRSLTFQYFRRNREDPYRRAAEVWRVHRGLDLDPVELAADLERRQVERARLVEEATGTLSALSGEFALGVITNGAAGIQRAKLERHGLVGFFEDVVVSGETQYMKPDDGIFEVARASLPADERVYVADRLAFDIVPARENGYLGVWISDRPSPVADLAVESVVELTPDVVRDLVDQR